MTGMANCGGISAFIALSLLLLLQNVDPSLGFTSNYVMVKLFSGDTKVYKGTEDIHMFPDVTKLFNITGADVAEM